MVGLVVAVARPDHKLRRECMDNKFSRKDEYAKRGLLGPIRAISNAQAKGFAIVVANELSPLSRRPRGRIMSKLFGKQRGAEKILASRINRHFDWEPLRQLALNSIILDSVEMVLGEDVVLWRSNIFYQHASLGDSLRWHRDIYPKILRDPNKQVSVQIALTPTRADNCMEVLPCSHTLTNDVLKEHFRLTTRKVTERAGNTNYHSSGEVPGVEQTVMAPGEFVLFHPKLLHRSSLTYAHVKPRICVTLRFTLPDNINREYASPDVVLLRGSPSGDLAEVDWRGETTKTSGA